MDGDDQNTEESVKGKESEEKEPASTNTTNVPPRFGGLFYLCVEVFWMSISVGVLLYLDSYNYFVTCFAIVQSQGRLFSDTFL